MEWDGWGSDGGDCGSYMDDGMRLGEKFGIKREKQIRIIFPSIWGYKKVFTHHLTKNWAAVH